MWLINLSYLFHTVLEAGKFKVKALEDLVSGESLPPDQEPWCFTSHPFTVSLPGKEVRELFGGTVSVMIPFKRIPSSWLKHLPKAHLLMPSHWDAGFQHMYFGGHKYSVHRRDDLGHFPHLTVEDLRLKEVKSVFTVTQALIAGTVWPPSIQFSSGGAMYLSKYPASLWGVHTNTLVQCSCSTYSILHSTCSYSQRQWLFASPIHCEVRTPSLPDSCTEGCCVPHTGQGVGVQGQIRHLPIQSISK